MTMTSPIPNKPAPEETELPQSPTEGGANSAPSDAFIMPEGTHEVGMAPERDPSLRQATLDKISDVKQRLAEVGGSVAKKAGALGESLATVENGFYGGAMRTARKLVTLHPFQAVQEFGGSFMKMTGGTWDMAGTATRGAVGSVANAGKTALKIRGFVARSPLLLFELMKRRLADPLFNTVGSVMSGGIPMPSIARGGGKKG